MIRPVWTRWGLEWRVQAAPEQVVELLIEVSRTRWIGTERKNAPPAGS